MSSSEGKSFIFSLVLKEYRSIVAVSKKQTFYKNQLLQTLCNLSQWTELWLEEEKSALSFGMSKKYILILFKMINF